MKRSKSKYIPPCLHLNIWVFLISGFLFFTSSFLVFWNSWNSSFRNSENSNSCQPEVGLHPLLVVGWRDLTRWWTWSWRWSGMLTYANAGTGSTCTLGPVSSAHFSLEVAGAQPSRRSVPTAGRNLSQADWPERGYRFNDCTVRQLVTD